MGNLSVNNAKMIITIGVIPIVIDNFTPDSDMWSVNTIETGDAEVTPDGKMNEWNKNALIECTLTLTGASNAGEVLINQLTQQTRIGSKPAISLPVQVVIQNDNYIETFANGKLVSGSGGNTYGNEKLANLTFTFKFLNRTKISI